MGKIKLSELAKKLNITSAELIDKLAKNGVEVKSASAILDESIIEKVMGVNMGIKKKEEKSKPEVHIIRRNVRVINTEGDKKEVEQITTNISGDIKKSHVVEENNKNNLQNRDSRPQSNRVKNQHDRKPRFDKNRNANIVITRNGQPIERKEEPKENVKVTSTEQVKDSENNVYNVKVQNTENKNDKRNYRENNYERKSKLCSRCRHKRLF